MISEIRKNLMLMLYIGATEIKANSEQVAIRNDKTKPMLFNNDSEYRTPTPGEWYSIEEEIERIRKEEEENK